MTAVSVAELLKRRSDFVALRDEMRERLFRLEESWVVAILEDRSAGHDAVQTAREQLAKADADVVMVDRILDRWGYDGTRL